MRKTALSALAFAVLLTGLSIGTAYAKHHHKRKPVVSAAACTASPLMRDETRFWACYPTNR